MRLREDGGSAITGYDLEFSVDGNEPWTDLTTSVTTTSFDDTGLTVGGTRHYRVAAINIVGTGEYSTTTDATTTATLTVPDAPTSLTAAPGDAQVTLSWVVPADGGDAITHYAIKIADTLGSFVGVQIAVGDLTGDGTSEGVNVNYIVTMTGVDSGAALVNGTTYFFQIAAINNVGTGEYSTTTDATTTATLTVSGAPTSLTAAPGDAQVTLSWVVPANGGDAITHYAIKIADTRDALGSFVAVQIAVGDLTGDGTSEGVNVNYIVTMTGVDSGSALVNGTTYFFQIAAINNVGTGAYSEETSATASPVVLSVPLEVEVGVYPNPGSDKVYVNLPNGAYVVRLHTLAGNVVLQKQLQGGGTRALSLSKLQNGVYILNLQKDGQSSSYRLIKAAH